MVAALLGLLLPLGILYYRAREELKRRDRIELIHWSTVHDFGMPPRPRHPPFAARVDGTYWRGNDERNPKLFNGGLYRTSVFHVKLRLPGGETLGHGGAAGGVAPELVYEIERAPHTPDFFWSDEIMGSIFVSRRSGYFVGSPEEPATDAVRLEALEPRQRWEAAYRLEKVPATGAFRDRGVLYVFEEVYEKDAASGAETMIGGRYHYGIEYDLRYQDGVLQPESDLWMGFLYRTRKAGLNKIWPDEWFSHEPLPVIPAPQGLDDAALGIDDRKPGGAAGNQG